MASGAHTLAKLTPGQRVQLIRQLGLDGAEELAELAAGGDAQSAAAMSQTLRALEADPQRLRQLVAAISDPTSRRATLAGLAAHVVDAATAPPAPAAPVRGGRAMAIAAPPAPQPATAEPQPRPEVPPPVAPQSAGLAIPPPPPADAPAPSPTALPPSPPPARAQSPQRPAPRPEPERLPAPLAPSSPSGVPPSPEASPLTGTAPPVSPAPLATMASMPLAAWPAPVSGEPAIPSASAPEPTPAHAGGAPVGAATEPAGRAGGTLGVLRQLRGRLTAGEPVEAAALAALFAHELPHDWARRRALGAFFAQRLPADLDQALALLGQVGSLADRRWALADLAASQPFADGEWERLLAMADTPALRRRLAARRQRA